MKKTEFDEHYKKLLQKSLLLSEKARRDGLLALEEEMEELFKEKICGRDIFVVGLRLVIDGTDKKIIEKILFNLIEQEKDEYTRLLKMIQREAVLLINDGINTRLVAAILDSYIDDSLSYESSKDFFTDIKVNNGEQEADDLDLG